MIVKHTGNRLETIGWKQICEGLGENTSLTKLDLSREHAQNTFCFMNNLFFLESFAIENDIGLFGTESDALRTNTTLIELRIWSLFNAFIEEKEYPFLFIDCFSSNQQKAESEAQKECHWENSSDQAKLSGNSISNSHNNFLEPAF